VKVILILATLLVAAACGNSSASSAPNFVVVSTDWRTTLVDPGTQDRQDCPQTAPGQLPILCTRIPGRAPTYQYVAHGIFRNQGASGSAVVTFSVVEFQTVYVPQPKPSNWPANMGPRMRPTTSPQTFSCNAVVKADAGQVAEASCPIEGISDTQSPPTATVSQSM
jgi:hypothetical protein